MSDIGHVELSGQPVERKTPGVPETISEDFAAARNTAEERVCWRRALGAICINAKHLAEKLHKVLSTISRIVAGTAVAHADVKIAVGPELDHSSVMVFVRLRNGEENGFSSSIRQVRIRRRGVIFSNHRRAIRTPCIIHEKAPVDRELRMKSEPQ